MSEFHVDVVKVGKIEPHPDADTLGITKVFDYQVIVKLDAFVEGQSAVYVPIDSLVPDTEEWHFLTGHNAEKYPVGKVPTRYRHIKAKRLRGIFSQGMLSPLPPNVENRTFYIGDDVADVMNITKYDGPEEPVNLHGDQERAPEGWVFPAYTDIEGLRRYTNVLVDDEEVVLTEKIHGTNAGFAHDGERLWVRSRQQVRKNMPGSAYWDVAESLGLAEKLKAYPFKVFFGEIFGNVQDLKYGLGNKIEFRCFDVFDSQLMRYLDHDDAVALIEKLGLPRVPQLYRGPWKTSLNDLCEGNSILADHVREGFVVKPIKERWHQHVGRVILKRCGEGYMLRK